jgi:hypothetical protein
LSMAVISAECIFVVCLLVKGVKSAKLF